MAAAAIASWLSTPAHNQLGVATITVTVTDSGGRTASDSFVLTIRAFVDLTKSDFNGDGRSDVLLQNDSGFRAVWLMNGTRVASARQLLLSNAGDPDWKIVGTGDLNSDGKSDIVFQHTDGTIAAWLMDGDRQVTAVLLNPLRPRDRNYAVAGTGDFNNDGMVDLLLQHSDGTLAVWTMDGVNLISGAFIEPAHPGDKNWRIMGLGDFDRDGNVDLGFQHTDGTLAAWLLDGVKLRSGVLLTPSHPGDRQWRVVGTADFNQDRRIDLLFQHAGDGSVATWLMDGATLSSAQFLTPNNPGGTWKVTAP